MKAISTFLLSIGLILIMSSCSQDHNPISSNQSSEQQFTDIKSAKNKKSRSSEPVTTIIQTASGTVYYKESSNQYAGMGFGHPSGSSFILQPGALTPPDDIPWGEAVTITMTVEKNLTDNTLIYTLEPSGYSFEPAAELWISWSDLGTESANLYYLAKNDRFIRENPDEIDYEGKKFKVLINHFSRYAVAYSD